MIRFTVRIVVSVMGMALVNSPAWAYYSVMDTGEIMAPGRYKLTPELQFITHNGAANIGTNFDVGLNEDMGLRAQIGAGDTDFYMAGFFKYMPFPDTDNQPALGFNAGVVYARDAGDNDFTFRIEPLIAKKLPVSFGAFTPYASIPLGIQHRSAAVYANDHNNLTAQLALGTQLDIKTVENVGFMLELGVDLNQTNNYVSFGAAWSFGADNSKN